MNLVILHDGEPRSKKSGFNFIFIRFSFFFTINVGVF